MESSARMLYVRASDPEAMLAGTGVEAAIRSCLGQGEHAPTDLDSLGGQAANWAAEQGERCRTLFAEAAPDIRREVLVRRTALGCAPLALVSGAWLQWLSGPGNAEDAAVLRALALYASDVGVGHPGASRGSAFGALLNGLRLSRYALPPARLSGDRRVADFAFHLPGLLLAMSRRPEDFTPEIIGADLCLRTVGLLPALTALRETLPAGADWAALDPGAARQPGEPSGAEMSRAAVDELISAADVEDRVAQGFSWALNELRHWHGLLFTELAGALDPVDEMVELIRQRAREGAVYHHAYLLEGRPLSAWLKESRSDPLPLLQALAVSKLVRPGRADRSPLTQGLVGENGPMFRIFAEADLAVIRRWIDALPDTGDRLTRAARPTPERNPSQEVPALILRAPAEEGRTPPDLRSAYHLLQGRRDTPALRAYAERYVHGWLARARHGIARGGPALPEQWTPDGLRPWLAEQHDRHSEEFESSADVPLPSREALVDSTVQLAPLTLIDGSWLRGFTDYEHASSQIGFSLFETYWDELGNGEQRLNHPLIYREVLAQMGVHLPPTGTAEFARWEGFADASFELPVYWLCVGRLPRTFMPEILGLNLAMELSGVGGTYRRARLALQKYGFDTRFVDIHNVIDNVATGHSAWAADAVDAFMTTVPPAQGNGACAAAWERVRVGYRSLNPPSGPRARRAARRGSRLLGSR
ncbi:iron-containing redox enzyme family protein [Streptomyces sp. NPDC050704]|uniref:iron-containing redox enzyme family protein n=1 Tax=Streptomyces sp. NPDC050704 TaxID=3157219 RepID=UPI00341AE420